MVKLGFLIISLTMLSACSTEKERMLEKGYPKQYADGYQDGCSTGQAAAGGIGSMDKKIRVYDSNKDYRRGWDDGRSLCYEREKSAQNVRLQNAIQSKLYQKNKK